MKLVTQSNTTFGEKVVSIRDAFYVHQVTLFGPRDGSSAAVESSSEDLVIDSSVLVMVASSSFWTAGG